MKVVFFLLILGNVVFFLWETGFRGAAEDSGQPALVLPDLSSRILLANESAESPEPPAPAPAEPASPPPAAVTSEPAPHADEPVAPGPAPAAAPDAPASAEEPAETPTCFQIGPFAGKGEANELLELIKPHAEAAEVVNKPADVPDAWWVIFPKAASPEAARENRRVLLEKGVQDLWLFDKGDLAGAISLGLFQARDKAEAAQAQFSKREIVTEIVPRMSRGHALWVRIPWSGPALELDEVVQIINSERGESRIPPPLPCN